MLLIAVMIGVFSGVTAAFQTPSAACHPVVDGIRFDGEYQPQVTTRLQELYHDDQNARQPGVKIEVSVLLEEDRQRREEALRYLQAGQVSRPADLMTAALLFHHGDCPAHFQLAAELARRAHTLGEPHAGWLYAAATDRYLLSQGNWQRYGTQYAPDMEGRLALCPVNSTTTDTERAHWGLPTLAELRARSSDFDHLFPLEPHPLIVMARIPVVGDLINYVVILAHCLT